MDISEWIDRHAAANPQKTAIRFTGQDISYAQLAAQIDRLASALAASGVKRGDCAAYLGFNSPEMLALLFACARLGALFMPLNWRLAAPEHKQMLDDCTPCVIVVESAFVAQSESCREAFPATTFVALSEAPAGWLTWQDFLGRANGPAPRDPHVTMDAPLLICYTSGSTGKPKGVLLTQNALAWNAANSTDMHALRGDDRILTVLPMFHVGGLNIQTTPALYAGCTVVLHPRFEPEAALDALAHDGITLMLVVPSVVDMMMASPRWDHADLPSLRMMSIGSTIVPVKMIEAVHARGVPMAQIYGSTETCPVATYLKAGDARLKVGSAGRAALHCEVKVADDAGREVHAGVTGEIVVRGPNVMSGYWNNPEATAAVLKDGWFHTGDMGHWDEDGYLFVDGRKKDMIISGGENIYPAEIENVLAECTDVAEAAVVGRPDARWGEVVVAVVVPKAGHRLDVSGVLKLFEGRIARYKHPKEVVFAEQLPRTALGKIRKEDVRLMVQRESVE